jgi:hypothetical protein
VGRHWGYDWIAEGKGKSHWLLIQDLQTGRTLQDEQLPNEADLKRVLINELCRWTRDGWTVEEFSSRDGGFFCNKDGKRVRIAIIPASPGNRKFLLPGSR